jgi:hypothetical protein
MVIRPLGVTAGHVSGLMVIRPLGVTAGNLIKFDPLLTPLTQGPTMEESKPRPIALEAHVLAYLGDYMSVMEESIKRLAQQEILKQGESVPADPKYTASARNRS